MKTRSAGLLVLAVAAVLSLPPTAHADFLILKDDNIIEVKVLRQVMRPGPFGKEVPMLECENERGEKRYIDPKDIKPDGHFPGKTSWELRVENLKWYEVTAPKTEQTWEARLRFARECRSDTRKLYEQSLVHFKEAYELRAALPLLANETEEQRHRKLAQWLEVDCGLADEATNEYAKVYEQIKAAQKDAKEHAVLAKWCVDHDLPEQADEQYKLAVQSAPDDKNLARTYEQFKRSLIIPLNHQMYNQLQRNLAAACKYLKSQQAANGSIGQDAERAGVQAIRGMTSISGEALMAEWDIKYFDDPEAAGKPPKEVVSALEFILSGTKGTGKFMGDDVWGPTLSLQFLVRAYSRPYLADRKKEIGDGINTAIADLKKLQRKDGGWNYYNFVQSSASFLSAAILVNLVAAKNLGFDVGAQMIEDAKKLIQATNYGKGTYMYSAEAVRESGKNTSFSPVGASARSPLCELAIMAAGAGNASNLQQAMVNFYTFQPLLGKLRGKAMTHVGTGKTAPYYFMFGHYWTARAGHQLPRNYCVNFQNWMYGALANAQNPDGTFHDFTGTPAYKVYATALGVLTMHELISSEPDLAFKAPAKADPPSQKLMPNPGDKKEQSPKK
jgi:hypothetical protein